MAHECRAHGVPTLGFSACYGELKIRARAGEPLSPAELEFVGYYSPRPHERGWIDASTLSTWELGSSELESTDPQVLAWLMGTGGREALEFMGL